MPGIPEESGLVSLVRWESLCLGPGMECFCQAHALRPLLCVPRRRTDQLVVSILLLGMNRICLVRD